MSSLKNKSSGSIEGERHPYMRASFWLNPANHWWEDDVIGPITKERYRKMVNQIIEKKAKLNLLP